MAFFALSFAVEAACAFVAGTAVTTIAAARAKANTFLLDFMFFPLFLFDQLPSHLLV